MKTYIPTEKLLMPITIRSIIYLRNYLQENPEKYNKFIQDALEVGVLREDKYKQLIRSKYTIDVINGFMMEAFIVSKANEDIEVLKKLFKIATKRQKVPHEEYVKQFEIIGTGFLSTKRKYPKYYNPSANEDILFLRNNKKDKVVEPATIVKRKEYASIQIKAIKNKNNLKYNILYPIISDKYSNVVTCLNYDNDYHTKEMCLNILDDLKEERKIIIHGSKKTINKEIRKKVKESIFCPDDIGIEQTEVDSYLEFIEAWYHGERGLDKIKFYENIEMAIRLLNESVMNISKTKLTFKVKQVSPVL